MYSTGNEGKSVLFLKDLLEPSRIKFANIWLQYIYIEKCLYWQIRDIVNKYNYKYHNIIKIKPADVKSSTYLDFNKENNKEDPKFRVGDHVGYQNKKMFLQNFSFQIGVEKLLKTLKTLCRGHMLLVILMVNKFLEQFTRKNCKKQIKESSELKK